MKLIALLTFCVALCRTRAQVIEDEPSDKDPIMHYGGLSDPFRMQKINLLWEKARKNLQESKLKALYSELKLQDKEELTLKRMKAEGGGTGDKDGMFDAEIRKKFNAIMNRYGLGGLTADEASKLGSYNQPKAYFKDKKLNRLWEKAEKAGLTEEEMITLKQEFRHHEEKVDQFHKLLEMADAVGLDENEKSNHIHLNEDDDEGEKRHANELSGKSKELKDDYHRLHRLATNQRPDGEFQEPKVESLWKLANHVNFSPDELDSIKTELHHFEIRLQKLHHLRAELAEVDARKTDHGDLNDLEKTQGRQIMEKKIDSHMKTIEKLEKDLAYRVTARHIEL